MILLDISNIFYRCIFQLEKLNAEFPEYKPSKEELLTSMLNEVSLVNDKFKYDWGRLMICCDGKSNWRYKYFKEYKQKRAEDKAKDERDWDYLRTKFEEIKEDLRNNSSWPVLEVPELEADDIIALIVKFSQDNLLIVSNDKDLNQLVDGSKVKQFSLMNNDYVSKEHHPLMEAILTGDAGDGVPNIFSDDNHYVREDKVRAKPVTKGMKEYFSDKILNEASLICYINEINEKSKDKLDLKKILHNYQRNRVMIDLKMIPSVYESEFKKVVVSSVEQANKNTKHQQWVDSIINNKNEESEDLDIGDLFDE